MTAQELVRMYVFNNFTLYNLLVTASQNVTGTVEAAEYLEKSFWRLAFSNFTVKWLIDWFDRAGLLWEDVSWYAIVEEYRAEVTKN